MVRTETSATGPRPETTMASLTRTVLHHATPIAPAPIQDAFAAAWPDAEVFNLLDDGLTIDRLRAGDAAANNRLVAEYMPRSERCGATMLAHLSASRAAGAVRADMPTPVFTAPAVAACGR